MRGIRPTNSIREKYWDEPDMSCMAGVETSDTTEIYGMMKSFEVKKNRVAGHKLTIPPGLIFRLGQ